MIACFPNTAPSTTSASLYLSLQLTLNLSQTFCPSLTHSSLTHHTSHYSTVRGQSEGVWGACVCVHLIGVVAHQCLTNPLSIFTVPRVGSQINWRNCTSKPKNLTFHWRNLRIFFFLKTEMSVAGMDNGIKLQIIFHHHSMWLSATGTMTRLMNASMVSNFTHNFMVCEGMCFVCVMGSQFPWFKVRQCINSWMIKMKQNLDSKSKKQKASWARAKTNILF